jgi:hypothetical protein
MDRLTITITTEHGRISRHSHDGSHVRELLGEERPAWLAERNRQGGAHTLETCDSCRARALVRQVRAEQWAREDAAYVAETDRLCNLTSHADRFSSSADRVSDTERTAAIRRQYGRIIKLARHCAERRIPELHKGYRVTQAELVNATTSAQHALGIVYGVGADILWSRWMDARQGGFKVKRHGTSDRARIIWSDLDHVDSQAMVRNDAGEWNLD